MRRSAGRRAGLRTLRFHDTSRRSSGKASSSLQRGGNMAARQIGDVRGGPTDGHAAGTVAAAVAVAVAAGGTRLISGRRSSPRGRGYGRQLQLNQHHVIAQTHRKVQWCLTGQEVVHL